MNSVLKTILIVIGIGLILYGTYTFIQPEASVDLIVAEVEEQDNTQSYLTIGLGVVLALIGAFVPKKS